MSITTVYVCSARTHDAKRVEAEFTHRDKAREWLSMASLLALTHVRLQVVQQIDHQKVPA